MGGEEWGESVKVSKCLLNVFQKRMHRKNAYYIYNIIQKKKEYQKKEIEKIEW